MHDGMKDRAKASKTVTRRQGESRVRIPDLACDHRILYGADGARFLDRTRNLLEEPLGLAL
jgi:pyruvate/2-oxoglutarate dehydrogenase complex dihydrolipoamide acyltransferase (E2) component